MDTSVPLTGDMRLYGRERELRLLRDQLDHVLDARGAVVLLSGAAGVGKSALLRTLAHEASERGACVLSGGCYDLSVTPPYGPWLELARAYRPAAPTMPAPPSSLTASLAARPASQAALFDEVLDFLSDLGRQHSVLLVLEDMHWADEASLDLLRVVARRAASLPLLLIATYRTEDVQRDTPLYRLLPLIVRESQAERLELQPLDRAALDALVTECYPLDHADRSRLVDYLVQQAEGNPFYSVELLRGLEDAAVLRPEGAAWQLGPIDRPAVPALLRQVIDARLARLPDAIQHHLLVAAVIGQDVPLAVWQSVLGIDTPALLATLEAALAAGVAEVMPDGLALRFTHSLIRGALYDTLLPPRRRMLHGQVADALLTLPQPDPDSVAWHLRQAHDERAVEWCIRAGERAQRAYAWTTAAERLSVAADLLAARQPTPVRERGWLLYRTGRLRRHADAGNAIGWLREAKSHGRAAHDAVLTAYACFDLGHIQVLTGDFRQGLERMIAGNRLIDALPPDHAPPGSDIAAWIADTLPQAAHPHETAQPPAHRHPRHGTLVQWLVEPGRFAEARQLAEPYLAALQDTPDLDAQLTSSAADAWFGLGRIHAAFGAPGAAREAFAAALACYQRIHHHLLIAGTLRVELTEVLLPYATTELATRRAQAAAAEEAYRQATGALPAHLSPRFTALELLLLEGEWDAARALLEPQVQRSAAMVTWRDRAIALLGRLACDQGDAERAWSCVRELLPDGPATQPGTVTFNRGIELQLVAIDLSLADSDNDRAASWLDALERWLSWGGTHRWQAEARLARSRYHQLSGDLPAARACADDALRIASDPRQPLALLAAYRTLGQLSVVAGEPSAADAYLSESLALAAACAAPFERARTLLALAERHLASAEREATRGALAEAGQIATRLNALPLLGQVERLAAEVQRRAADDVAAFGLSNRELDVLRLVAQGLTDAEVADQLFISYRTVTTHLTSIFNKLGVNSRVSATRIAVERGLV
jgi:DNA-binding CsgD family transcriptional regulator